jgi:SH3-like domain-containing protein
MRRFGHYLLLLILLISLACNTLQSSTEQLLYETITTSRQNHIYERPALRTARLETLKEGERIQVLQEPRNRWLKIRTATGKVGWIETRDVLKRDYFDQWQELAPQVQKQQLQMQGDTLAEAYLRLQPGRDTVKVYKLVENQPVDIFAIAYTERPLPAGSAAPKPPAPVKKLVASPTPLPGKKGKKSRRSADNGKKYDTWYLVRTAQGATGWIFAGLVSLRIPEEVARFAESKLITTWRNIGKITDPEGNAHPSYLLLEREENTPRDFDRLRVLSWNRGRKRYDTTARVSDLVGFLPLEFYAPNSEITTYRFKIQHFNSEDARQIFTDEYETNGVQLKKLNRTVEDF